ncbi:MAG: hypothetical protein H0W74_13755 [Sphingosinicella sp.]|nr:hypothetical protein [Sphingosinicella sp.]
MAGAVALLSLQLIGVAGAQPLSINAAEQPASAGRAQLREEDFLLFAVQLDGGTLTEGLSAYGATQDPLLPVGELSRLLDLNIDVSPSQGTIAGTIGESARSVTVDLALGLVRAGGKNLPLAPQDTAVTPTDIFIRASVLEKILPVKIIVDTETLEIKLVATEKLPVQSRIERQGRKGGVNSDTGSTDPVLKIESPYLLFAPPAFDIALATGTDTRSPRFPRRYDVRVAGDLLYMGYQGYLGSDEAAKPSTARLMFERRSPQGNLLGPIGATYASAGDVFTPGMALGPRSVGGRGISFTTAKLGETSVFQRITLRGELPIGYDVELYVNDVLRSGQRSPVEGRYEFIDVPLVRGLNVIRLVTYGPRGERSEQSRVVNVGGGQLAKGEFNLDFGLVQQDQALFDLRSPEEKAVALAGEGKMRAVANMAYGVTNGFTLVGGAALYPGFEGERRAVAILGARGSLFGFAAQADAGRDSRGGRAVALGLAGQPFGISALGRHAEYAGGFIDETLRVFSAARPLSRHSELTLDVSLPPIGGKIIPLSFRAERDGYDDGGTTWLALARASATIADTLISTGLDFQRETIPATGTTNRLTGNFAASKFVDYKWQLRGVVDYDILPDKALRAAAFTASRQVSDRLGIQFGAGKTFGKEKDLSLQAGAFFRLPFADLAFTGDYATAKKDWRVGVRLAFGLAFDPGIRNYRATRPGAASGGSAAFHAFIDSDGDGQYDRGESGVPKLTVEGGESKITTNAKGRAFIPGLGNSISHQLRVGTDDIDNFYISSPPSNVEFASRPGHTIEIPYPLAAVAEVVARVRLNQDGKDIGLAAVRVRLVRDGSAPIEGTTEFDGSVIFGNVRPGTYRFEIEPEQAAQLRMRLKQPIEVAVTPDESQNINAEVVFGAEPG